jgi:hypothetical protein
VFLPRRGQLIGQVSWRVVSGPNRGDAWPHDPDDFEYELDLSLEGDQYTALGPDLFECLMTVRRQYLDPKSWRIACNGARENAWASGMLRSSGGGTDVYLLRGTTNGKLRVVPTFGRAPKRSVVTVERQVAYYQRASGVVTPFPNPSR